MNLPENAFSQSDQFNTIVKKWIDYAKANNNIEAAIWWAVQETKKLYDWISVEDKLPSDETPVLIIRKDSLGNSLLGIGELRWDHPTWEENYKSYQYWDDPNNEGQEWDFDSVTHWMFKPDPADAITDEITEQITESIKDTSKEVPNIDLIDLDISVYVINRLKKGGITTLSELLNMPYHKLRGVDGIGKVCVNNIKSALAKYNLFLNESRYPWGY